MTTFTNAIQSGDSKVLSALMWRRFCGEHLDTPFNRGRGEAPRELVASIFESATTDHGASAQLLINSLRHLLQFVALPAMQDALVKQTSKLLPGLMELFLFIEECRPDGIEDDLIEIGPKALRMVERKDGFEHVVSSFFRAAAKYIDNHQIAHLCSSALAVPAATLELAVDIASLAPRHFIGTILPGLLFTLGNRSDLKTHEITKLRECARVALSQIVDTPGLISEVVEGLCRPVAAIADFPAGETIHIAVIEALALADVPAFVIRVFEDTYWDKHPRRDALTDPKLKNEKVELGQRVKELVRRTFSLKVPPLRINSFPYAEGVLLHLTRIALKVAYNIDVDVVPCNYNHVQQELIDGNIDIAAHNPSFYKQIAASDMQFVESPHLIRFSGYKLLASIRKLRYLVRNGEVSTSVRTVASDLLDNGRIAARSDDDADSISNLLQAGRLTCLLHSDTHDVAREAFGDMRVKLSDDVIDDLGPDEGFEKVLDGDVLFYLGGALQSHYGMKVCPSRVREVLDIDRKVYVQYYMRKSVYEENVDLYNLFLKCWPATKLLWGYLTKQQGLVSEKFARLIASLRDDILVSLNRDRGIQIGFAPSFSKLQDVLEQHDEILAVSEDPVFTPTDRKRPSYVSVVR